MICSAWNQRLLRLCQLYAIGGEWTDSAFFMGMKAAMEVLGISGRNSLPALSRHAERKDA